MTATGWTWLPAALVRVLHAWLINGFSGLHGDGGPGDLDAVLARPQNLVEQEPDVDACDLAGAHAEALARGPAFTDGNKRIAFMAAMVFLRLNGVPIPERDEAKATERTLALAAGVITRIEYAHWLRGWTDRDQQPRTARRNRWPASRVRSQVVRRRADSATDCAEAARCGRIRTGITRWAGDGTEDVAWSGPGPVTGAKVPCCSGDQRPPWK